MQGRIGVVACLWIGLAGAGAAWAQDARPSPGVLAPSERDAARAPIVMRGASAAPAEALAVEFPQQRWQIVAGKRLWLVDLTTFEVSSCADRDTSTVGVREIRCTSGELGRYGRTFGRNFNP